MFVCSEVRERKNSSKHQQRQRPYSEPGRRSPDASNIATDCQKNRYPSFISCPYNSRQLTSSSVWKNDAHRSCPKPKQIVSTVCYKINLSLYPVSSKLAITYVNIKESLHILCTKNCGYWSVFVEVIWKYNSGPVILNCSVLIQLAILFTISTPKYILSRRIHSGFSHTP